MPPGERSQVLYPGATGGGLEARPARFRGWCYRWFTTSTEELLAQVLRLPRSERARVTSELLSSLEEPEDVVAQAWASELERRSSEVTAGIVQTVDWAHAKADLLAELKARRAARSSS